MKAAIEHISHFVPTDSFFEMIRQANDVLGDQVSSLLCSNSIDV